MAKATPNQDDAFAELDTPPEKKAPVKKAPVKGPSFSFELPAGVDPKLAEKITANLGKMVRDQIAASDGVSNGRLKYLEESKKRYRCVVSSLRPGWDHFEMMIPDLNDNPKPVRGRCGVILEDGLTMFAIRQLQYTHDYRTEKGQSLSIDQILSSDTALVLTHKSVKQPHYSVEILGEVENPRQLNEKIGGK